MSRLVILAPNWIGDAVMALPAIASVRQWQAGAHLAVAARQSVAPLFSMVPGIDAVVTLRGRGGWPDAWRTWADARTLDAGNYDAALLLPNSLHAALLARAAGIPQRWGYAADVRSRMLTRALRNRSGFTHQAEYYLHSCAGWERCGRRWWPNCSRPKRIASERQPCSVSWVGTERQLSHSRRARRSAWRNAGLRSDGRRRGYARRPAARDAVLVGTGADRSATREVARDVQTRPRRARRRLSIRRAAPSH